MESSFEITAEDIRLFLDEAEELLQVMEGGILRLEQVADDPEVIQEIFRAAHTLKGSSATLGHQRMAELTHKMENVLDRIRKGKLAVSTDLADTLLDCLDILKTFKDEITKQEESGVDLTEILQRLAGFDGAETPPESGRPGGQAKGARISLPHLAPEQIARLREAVGLGHTAAIAHLTISPSSAMPAVRAFQALLAAGDVGEVLASTPTQEEVETDQIGDSLTLILLTTEALDRVQEALSVDDIAVATLRELDLAQDLPGQTGAPAATGTAADRAEPVARRSAAAAPGKTERKGARTIRVDVGVLDNLMNIVGEMVIERTRMLAVASQIEANRTGDDISLALSAALTQMGRLTSTLQEEIQRARMLPVETLFRKFPRMVRDVAQKAGKEIEFVVKGEETELDRSVIEEIGDPLMHLLRNAIDHGVEPAADRRAAGKPEKGTVTLEAFHEENHIIICVRDDGRGVDPVKMRASAVRKGLISEEAASRLSDHEAINLIWTPGFSTAAKVSDISGRGVGLDVVQKNIEKLNGSVEIRSTVGTGTEFRIRLPLTLAIIRALQVRADDTTYCIPLGSVVEIDRVARDGIKWANQQPVIVKRGEIIPLIRLTESLGGTGALEGDEAAELQVVIVTVRGRQIGLVVDAMIGEGEVVIKPLSKYMGEIPGISGATIMGDGSVAIILDVASMVQHL